MVKTYLYVSLPLNLLLASILICLFPGGKSYVVKWIHLLLSTTDNLMNFALMIMMV